MLREKFKLFIFDLDGTLIDSQTDILNSVNYVRKNFNLPMLDIATVRSYIGDGANILVKKIFPGASDEDLKKAFIEFKEHYLEHPVDNTKAYPSIVEMLDKLKDKQKAVLTNKPEAISRKILKKLGIESYFSVVWGGDTGPFRKPDPDPIHKILAQLNVKPGEAVLIGDGINDIRAAKSAGIKTVGLGYGYSEKSKILDLKPDYFADTPQELLELI